MKVCRFCLSQKPRKNITNLEVSDENGIMNYQDIVLFCLGIEIGEDSNISTALCVKCFRNIIEFHKFKSKARKSEDYLKSLEGNQPPPNCKSEVHKDIIPETEVPIDIENIKTELFESVDDGFDFNDSEEHNVIKIDIKLDETEVKIKPELEAETELFNECFDSNEIKYEFIEEKVVNSGINKRKGRRKKSTVPRVKVPKTKQDIKKGPIKICDECGIHIRDLRAHKITHLPKEQRPREHKCEMCDKMFLSSISRHIHMKRMHLAQKKECHICHKKVSVAYFTSHLKFHDPEGAKFECAVCGRRFVFKIQLEEHVSIHTNDRPWECPTCKKTFRLRVNLQKHTRQVHDKERTHVCHYCSKGFFKKDKMELHMRSHTKEKPYGCSICGKFFSSTTMLKSHTEIHSTEKKFSCNECNMTFTKKCYVKTHMKSHTKEKRYPCQFCGVRFHRSDHRKRHEFTAHLKHSKTKLETTDDGPLKIETEKKSIVC